jgi:Flavodoxin-like fold
MLSKRTRKILIVNGNPTKQRVTLSEALAKSYGHHAQEAGYSVTSMKLSGLIFDPIQHEGYDNNQPLETGLITLRSSMVTADHWVLIFRLWYGLPPALFKGFTFEYEGFYPVLLPILKAKTVRGTLRYNHYIESLHRLAQKGAS